MTSMSGVLEAMVERLGCREDCRFEERSDGHGGTCTVTVMGLIFEQVIEILLRFDPIFRIAVNEGGLTTHYL